MCEYVHLHRKIVASWVFEDPRRLQLFIYLLAKADERGVVRLSVNGYANAYGYQRMQVVRILQAMEEEGIIVQQTSNKCSTITLCKYAYYNETSAQSCSTGEQQTSNAAPSQEEKEEARERKVPPHPLIKKEKEEKREEAPLLLLNTHEECDFGEETSGDVIDTTRLDAEITALASSQQRMEVLAMREHLTVEEVRARLQGFRLECMAQGTLSHRNLEDTFRHFGNWIRIRLKNERQEHGSNRQNNEREQLMERMQGYAAVVAEFRSKRGTGKVRQPGEVPDDLPF
jgi:hypothetical protein